ncbi:Uncharacterised protein [Acinetobacter phage MD-2021a]|nr:Uncharacterised protein [Acinetobacter phage MD-2021a]
MAIGKIRWKRDQNTKETAMSEVGKFEEALQQHKDILVKELIKLGKNRQAEFVVWDIEKNQVDYEYYFNAGGSHILLSDLKRLVESLDLVVFLGGIDGLNVLLDMANSPFALSGVTRDGVFYSSEKIKEIVAVHESIYGGGE